MVYADLLFAALVCFHSHTLEVVLPAPSTSYSKAALAYSGAPGGERH